jgi:serine/threonine protein kinase
MSPVTFGKYELLKKVGLGGMAELFLARQSGIEGFEKLIVIKRILPHLADSAEFIQMFLNEARLAARLTHPNVVQIYDLGRVGGQYFIAMEYVNGVDLSRVLKKERKARRFVPTEHAVKMMSYVCEALTYAHSHTDVRGNPLSIVHRDISPHNVLVAFDGGVKITDFGIAKAATQAVKTKAGTLKGKYYYMSPEQCLGRKMDHRSDIFSAGILLYQMMTGRLPFRGDSEFSVLHAIVHDAPRPPSVHREDFPAGLYPILERSMAKHAEDRYDTALQMQMALEKFLMEQKLVSNTTLIGKYVQGLFPEVLEALKKMNMEGGADIEEIIDGLAIAGADRLTPSKPGATPSGDLTPGPLATPTPEGARSPSAVIRQAGSDVAVGATGPADLDDDIPILTPSMVTAYPTTPHKPSAIQAAAPPKKKTSWRTPILITAVFLSAVCGALLVHFLGQMENEKTPPVEIQPAGIAAENPAGEKPKVEEKPPAKEEAKEEAKKEEKAKPPPAPKRRKKKRRMVASKIRKKPSEEDDVEEIPDEPPPATRATGYLTLDTNPWTEVYFQGKRLGLTPLAYLKLPAGKLKLLLRNREKNIQKTILIEIKPNETTIKQLDLQ